MAGIERINIISNWRDTYTQISLDSQYMANFVYRYFFNKCGMRLQDGDIITDVNKEEVKARYDYQEGIDIILTFIDGSKSTMQEKILTYHTDTVTFEETKRDGSPGGWYYCTSQYYFVGYLNSDRKKIRSGIMMNLADLHQNDLLGKINWRFNNEKKLKRGTSFRYIPFNDVPNSSIIFRL